jgi:N-methylhydantoinase B
MFIEHYGLRPDSGGPGEHRGGLGVSRVYRFTAPSVPGTYFFRCDFHPVTMSGTFVVT